MSTHRRDTRTSWMGEIEKTNRKAMRDPAYARRVVMMRFAMFGGTPIGGLVGWLLVR